MDPNEGAPIGEPALSVCACVKIKSSLFALVQGHVPAMSATVFAVVVCDFPPEQHQHLAEDKTLVSTDSAIPELDGDKAEKCR